MKLLDVWTFMMLSLVGALMITMFLIHIAPIQRTASEAIPGQFVKYVSRFEESWGQRVGDYISIRYDKHTSPQIGSCDVFTGEITVDFEYWATSSESAREELLFHEMGHCVLFRGHHDEFMEDDPKCPESVMHSNTIDGCYELYRDHYIRELFKGWRR